jgi:hypothetical protein
VLEVLGRCGRAGPVYGRSGSLWARIRSVESAGAARSPFTVIAGSRSTNAIASIRETQEMLDFYAKPPRPTGKRYQRRVRRERRDGRRGRFARTVPETSRRSTLPPSPPPPTCGAPPARPWWTPTGVNWPPDTTGPWLSPLREALRRDVLDAYLHLATTAPPDHAARLVSVAADPYNAYLIDRAAALSGCHRQGRDTDGCSAIRNGHFRPAQDPPKVRGTDEVRRRGWPTNSSTVGGRSRARSSPF